MKPKPRDIPAFILRRTTRKVAPVSRHRVGIYAGTFDPVHAGHIAFALQAIDKAALDEVIFLPERKPRYKTGVEHFGHRVAMLNRAVKPHPKLSVAELVDAKFTVSRTLPQLKASMSHAEFVFLFGSDVVPRLPDWPGAERLLHNAELVVGVRSGESPKRITQVINSWPIKPKAHYVFKSHAPKVSSRSVREAIRSRQNRDGALASVIQYARHNWLYVALP